MLSNGSASLLDNNSGEFVCSSGIEIRLKPFAEVRIQQGKQQRSTAQRQKGTQLAHDSL